MAQKHKIRIIARDAEGTATEYLHFSVPELAEVAFIAFTRDPTACHHNEDNWYLEVRQYADEDGVLSNEIPMRAYYTVEWICVDWHCPIQSKYQPTTGHVDGFHKRSPLTNPVQPIQAKQPVTKG